MKNLFVTAILILTFFGFSYGDNSRVEELEKQCEKGSGKACYELASIYFKGKGGKVNIKKAFIYTGKACKFDHPKGCVDFGLLLTGIKKYEIAFRAFEKACKLGEGLGCSNMGVYYAKGLAVEKDLKKAKHLYEKACNMGNGRGCSNLGFMYQVGEAGEKNPYKAQKLYIKGCKLNDMEACHNAAVSFYKGITGQKSLKKARGYFEKACRLGYRVSCKILKENF